MNNENTNIVRSYNPHSRIAEACPSSDKIRVIVITENAADASHILENLPERSFLTHICDMNGVNAQISISDPDVAVFNKAEHTSAGFCGRIAPIIGDIPLIVVMRPSEIDLAAETADHECVADIVFADRTFILPKLAAKRGSERRESRFMRSATGILDDGSEYSSLVNNLKAIVIRTNRKGEILRVNNAFYAITGYDHSDYPLINIRDMYENPNDRAIVLSRLKDEGKILNLKCGFKKKNGSTMTGRISAYLYSSGSGEYIEAIIEDISELVSAESLLDHSSRDLKVLIDSITEILIGVSKEDVITHWNRVAETTFAIPSDDVIGTKITTCGIRWQWDEIYMGIADSVSTGQPVSLDPLIFDKTTGERGALSLTINAMKYRSSNDVEGFIIIGRDLTEKRKMELIIENTRKMESIGQLSAGIAHEINSPMQFIVDNIDYARTRIAEITDIGSRCFSLLTSLPETETDVRMKELLQMKNAINYEHIASEVPKALSDALDGSERIRSIVTAMKRFAHPGGAEMRPTDVNMVIRNVVTLSRNRWKYDSDLITDLQEDMPEINCIESDLSQVILNLIINAHDAVSESISGGLITRGKLSVSSKLYGGYAEIRVSDNGPGIPDPIKNRIFDPYFTTKDIGKGTGQGLSICYTIIVNKFKGAIACEDAPGGGALFTIRIPAGNGGNITNNGGAYGKSDSVR
jgi:PAS domain S-box-containing protein